MPDSSTTFIYALADPRKPEIIRYVGKSDNPQKRLRYHLQESTYRPNSRRSKWLRSLTKAEVTPVLILVEECPATEWRSRELFWIAHYRGVGCDLVNSTDGGGERATPLPEICAKISASKQGQRKGVPLSPEHRAKIGAALKGQVIPPETRAKMSASAKVKVFTPEHRAKLSENLRNHPPGPEARAKSAAKRAGDYMLMSPEGETFEVKGLAGFCREHGLHPGNMLSLLAGRIQYNKGWRIWRPGEPVPSAPVPKGVRMAEKFKGRVMSQGARAKLSAARSMHFIATTPTGEEIHGSNLTAFCAEHGLNRQSMQRILKGETDQVKGWRIRRPEDI